MGVGGEEGPEMICGLCGKAGARIQRVTKAYGKGKDLLVIENVPVISCRSCHDGYYTAETLHELERIRAHPEQFAAKRSVAVAEYP